MRRIHRPSWPTALRQTPAALALLMLAAAAPLAAQATATPSFYVATKATAADSAGNSGAVTGVNIANDYWMGYPVSAGQTVDWTNPDCIPNGPTNDCRASAGSMHNGGSHPEQATTSSSHATSYLRGYPWGYVSPNDPILGPTHGRADATASLESGKVGVYAEGQYRSQSYPHVNGSGANALGRIQDYVNFHIAGADANTRTRLGVTFEIDGSFTGSDARAQYWAEFGRAGQLVYGSFGPNYTATANNQGMAHVDYLQLTPNLVAFTAWVDVYGADVLLGVGLEMRAFAGAWGGTAAFDHTGKFSFVLPSNVTWESASGVLLRDANPSNPGNPVPEPGSLALAAVAMGLLTRMRRRGSVEC